MIATIPALRRYIDVTDSEEEAIHSVERKYPWHITDYFASLMDPVERSCPIRRQAVPAIEELDDSRFGDDDPLSEDANSPAPGVIRVYPDRIAVIVTNRCPVYCRHCLRKRMAGDRGEDLRGNRLSGVIDYVAGDPSIRDILLTGGDPLMLDDSELDDILGKFRSIEHVEIIRIGTRAPCTWPERITEAFADMVARHHPVWISTQFNHPREVTPEAEQAVDILMRRGIPINNQSVLLKGVNDSSVVMIELVRKLVRARVRPYYLYQAQTLAGTGHFITPIETGLDIVRSIRGYTTGFAAPQYVLDTPNGKIPLNPAYLKGRNGEYFEMTDYRGGLWREWNPLRD